MLPLIKCVLVQYVDNEELTYEISNVLCDTGAETSIISSDDIPSKFIKEESPSITLSNAIERSFASCEEQLVCNIRLPSDNLEITNCKMFILKNSAQLAFSAILGMNVLKKVQLRVGHQDNILQINRMNCTMNVLEIKVTPSGNIPGLTLENDIYLWPGETHRIAKVKVYNQTDDTPALNFIRTVPRLEDNQIQVENRRRKKHHNHMKKVYSRLWLRLRIFPTRKKWSTRRNSKTGSTDATSLQKKFQLLKKSTISFNKRLRNIEKSLDRLLKNINGILQETPQITDYLKNSWVN